MNWIQNLFLKYVENTNSIFVRIYVYGFANACKQVCTESYATHKPVSGSHNNSITYLVQPYYNVLFITHNSMKSNEDIHMCKLNTTGTINKRYHLNDTGSALVIQMLLPLPMTNTCLLSAEITECFS